jgi:hypothetical protein
MKSLHYLNLPTFISPSQIILCRRYSSIRQIFRSRKTILLLHLACFRMYHLSVLSCSFVMSTLPGALFFRLLANLCKPVHNNFHLESSWVSLLIFLCFPSQIGSNFLHWNSSLQCPIYSSRVFLSMLTLILFKLYLYY